MLKELEKVEISMVILELAEIIIGKIKMNGALSLAIVIYVC